jgi:uncharacterized protein YjiS (DUF1127 family)
MSQVLRHGIVRAQIGRIDGRRLLAALAGWRERRRQRRELMTLLRDGFDFGDFGVTRALAAKEAQKFPWQEFDDQWQPAADARGTPAARRQNEY